MLTANGAVALAERLLAERYPKADFAFAAGSIVRGEGKPRSDLDLVVVFASRRRAGRESFTADGTPVDAFLHDPETLAFALKEEVEIGRPAMHSMVAESVVVGPKRAAARPIAAKAHRALAHGPGPLPKARLELLRYHITDRLDDLRDPRPVEEVLGTFVRLYEPLAELILRGAGRWMGNGKWVVRHLRDLDPTMADAYLDAFDTLFSRHDAAPLIAFAEAALAPHGGELFDGYKAQWPAASRVTRAKP